MELCADVRGRVFDERRQMSITFTAQELCLGGLQNSKSIEETPTLAGVFVCCVHAGIIIILQIADKSQEIIKLNKQLTNSRLIGATNKK